MAVLKDWELANLRIWLTEIDIDGGLDFPILSIYFCKCQKADEKKSNRTSKLWKN